MEIDGLKPQDKIVYNIWIIMASVPKQNHQNHKNIVMLKNKRLKTVNHIKPINIYDLGKSHIL